MRTMGEVWSTANKLKSPPPHIPSNFIAGRLKAAFLFWFFRGFRCGVRLAGGHLYGKQLFTWLSLVVSLTASFLLSFFPLDVLDEILDVIESVSEGFLTYSDHGVFIE